MTISHPGYKDCYDCLGWCSWYFLLWSQNFGLRLLLKPWRRSQSDWNLKARSFAQFLYYSVILSRLFVSLFVLFNFFSRLEKNVVATHLLFLSCKTKRRNTIVVLLFIFLVWFCIVLFYIEGWHSDLVFFASVMDKYSLV